MKKHQLQALVAVAEHGSIRRAAQALSLSQTALTKSLRELELDLQAALLLRSPQGVRLTSIGLTLLQHAKLILTEMDQARFAVKHMLKQEAPPVKVAVTPVFSLLCLPETLSHFQVRYADAPLSIRDAFLSQTLPMLRDGTIDLAITALMPDALGSDLTFEVILDVPIALAGSYTMDDSTSHTLASLAASKQWLLDSSPWGISEAIRQWLTLHGVEQPRQRIECSSSMASLVLSMQKNAISPMPKPILSVPWIAAITKEIPLPEVLPQLPVGLVMRKGHRLNAPAEWFAECAKIALQELLTPNTGKPSRLLR